MKYILRKICLITFLISPVVYAAPTLFEDFSGSMSLDKFTAGENNQTVVSGELVLSSRASSLSKGNARSPQAFLINSAGVTNYSADLKITALSLGNTETQQAELRIFGQYYYTAVGRAWVSIVLGDRGNGLEAWYIIYNDAYDINGQYVSSEIFTQGSLASSGLSLNTSYSASINYDGGTGLTFTFNNGTPVTVSGPAKTGDSPFWRGVGTRVRFGHNNSTPSDFNDELPEDGSTAFVAGTVDNVATDIAGPEDDFSTTNLDNWNKLPNSTLITNDGQLEMTIAQAGSDNVTQRVRLVPQDLKYVGAKVTLSSESTPVGLARLRARITEYLGNDTYDVSNGDTQNGEEGNIWTRISLDRFFDGTFGVSAYIERYNTADFTDATEILFQNLTPTRTIAYDKQFELAIELVDKVVNYIVDGEVLLSFDLATSDTFSGNLYSSVGNATQLQARIQNGPGKIVALFDDIFINENRNVFTRAEIAKPLLQAIYGKAFVPDTANGLLYSDVNIGDFNADWIEKLAVDDITEGCAMGKFCPNMVVSKEQLSKLLLKAKHTSAYMPAPPNGTVFDDISLGSFAADWIEELANQAISSGCDTNNFCPKDVFTITSFESMLGRAF